MFNNAHVWESPAVIETAVAPTVNAATATGAELAVVVPLPSCPSPLVPQQLTAPVFNNAHVWEPPAVIETAVADPSVNGPPQPAPNCQWCCRCRAARNCWPQQLTAPVFNNAHVWKPPAAICGVTPVPNVLLGLKTLAVFGANTEAKLPDTPATTGPSTPKLFPVPISACSTAISGDCDPSDNANTGTDDPTDATTNAPAAITTTKRLTRANFNTMIRGCFQFRGHTDVPDLLTVTTNYSRHPNQQPATGNARMLDDYSRVDGSDVVAGNQQCRKTPCSLVCRATAYLTRNQHRRHHGRTSTRNPARQYESEHCSSRNPHRFLDGFNISCSNGRGPGPIPPGVPQGSVLTGGSTAT